MSRKSNGSRPYAGFFLHYRNFFLMIFYTKKRQHSRPKTQLEKILRPSRHISLFRYVSKSYCSCRTKLQCVYVNLCSNINVISQHIFKFICVSYKILSSTCKMWNEIKTKQYIVTSKQNVYIYAVYCIYIYIYIQNKITNWSY